MRAAERPPEPESLELLRAGEIEVKGRLPWSSNGTFLVDLCLHGPDGDVTADRAVYKPGAGERALWDYPNGLFRRERAVYVVSEALGWGLVPQTVLRDGPLGPGSLQRFVPSDFREHYFTLLERPEHHAALRTICLLDLVVNNGDRKAGHCLLGDDGRLWAIDHGLCLHEEPKLRTVIWDFAGQPFPPDQVDDVRRVAMAPPDELRHLLSEDELDALVDRSIELVRRPFFPRARTHWAYPWPLI
ncbi:MAG TPA: SCO1664 family protein [Acidimicrobiales bacterium]